MAEAFYIIIHRFGQELDLPGIAVPFSVISFTAIIIFALLSCFFGFKLVRLWCAVMAFVITAIAVCHILKPTAHMGIVVTTFAVVGLVAAFLVYHWFRLSVFLLMALIGYSIAAFFTPNIWIGLGIALVLAAISIPFSVIITILFTAIWGGITLGFEGLSYLGVTLPAYKIMAAAGLAALGLFVQYSMNKTHLTDLTDFISRLKFLASRRPETYSEMSAGLLNTEKKQDSAKVDKVFRKEIKYPISVLDFYRLRPHLECFVKPDQYSGYTGYRVRSLYFDSDNDQDLLDNLAGQMEKRKIRLRFYPPDTGYIRLEYKCKSGTDGVKRSIKLSREVAEQLMKGNYSPLLDLQEPLALELYGRMMLGGYQPKVVVDYHRLAYTYPVSNTRINFDSEVSASYVTASFFDENPGLIPVIDPGTGVLEVKYDHFLAGILKEIVQSVDSLTKANSKYAQSRYLF